MAPTITFEASPKPSRVRLDVVPLVGPRHGSVLVVALDDGWPVSARRLRGDAAPVAWDIPLEGRWRGPTSVVRLRLLVLVPCSPTRAGRDGPVDHRPLGVRVLRLRWTP
jgi:hypothetical protein